MDRVASIIRRVAEKRFAGTAIVKVDVARDSDSDGDPIWRVDIVFDNETGRLPAEKLVGFIGQIRAALDAEDLTGDERLFPVIYYDWQGDARPRNRAEVR